MKKKGNDITAPITNSYMNSEQNYVQIGNKIFIRSFCNGIASHKKKNKKTTKL